MCKEGVSLILGFVLILGFLFWKMKIFRLRYLEGEGTEKVLNDSWEGALPQILTSEYR